METTLVLIKPDGVRRGVIGKILTRFEDRGLQLKACSLIEPPTALLEQHYADHVTKTHWPLILYSMQSGPVMALALEGKSAVQLVRLMVGATDPVVAAPGTIRGDFAIDLGRNLIHASDSVDSAVRELALWFPCNPVTGESALCEYPPREFIYRKVCLGCLHHQKHTGHTM
ncbi:nucleoside diphosphate kinase [Anguillid herpesvirus 1]|uniref:Nucleoside diphosphate kinase n=1 Tax=Anguillid herpesvirus 1 TaxID=150286 RepID=A0A1J0REK7_9VIRU|nr:nucleoside diphosphate kinase [Anguillid herpesvirus 1]ADA57853.2 nucleoside diphosphate kinase [Anguillid herpesvirus 1]APD76252.1 nucleoside diphosphate kinase [Anguillid herpesvirus 1]QRM16383.1 nucleoside diphosphate kinase [Anguillid herpesvirus 1]QRM16511.1 nucleoside diphosphate kinase [Anguillid herpesvirus 1]QRM16642.1 nucleoside diphosphate kinase [Anguillid herpesvirus 1]